jgi:hypothetical protein
MVIENSQNLLRKERSGAGRKPERSFHRRLAFWPYIDRVFKPSGRQGIRKEAIDVLSGLRCFLGPSVLPVESEMFPFGSALFRIPDGQLARAQWPYSPRNQLFSLDIGPVLDDTYFSVAKWPALVSSCNFWCGARIKKRVEDPRVNFWPSNARLCSFNVKVTSGDGLPFLQ